MRVSVRPAPDGIGAGPVYPHHLWGQDISLYRYTGRCHQLRGWRLLWGYRGLYGEEDGQCHDASGRHRGLHPHDALCHPDHGGRGAGTVLDHPGPGADLLD